MLDIEEFEKKIDKKSRLLGIDPGKKRIGIAISEIIIDSRPGKERIIPFKINLLFLIIVMKYFLDNYL
jgi:hypothetical protein